jgi:hypothetical protein
MIAIIMLRRQGQQHEETAPPAPATIPIGAAYSDEATAKQSALNQEEFIPY